MRVPISETNRWRAVVRVLRSTADVAACTFLPDSCSFCGSPLPRLSSAPICDACWSEVTSLSHPGCTRCGDRLDPRSTLRKFEQCRACRLVPPAFQRAVSYGHYQGRLRQAIHALKYDGMQSAAIELGNRLALAMDELRPDAPSEMLVVPVPLHRTRYRTRGFNQTRLLASQAVSCLAVTQPEWRLTLAPQALLRMRATATQAGLTPRMRRRNVRKAFSVENAAVIAGRDILLVDDIFTTGATARAASQALLEAGATSVWVATAARALTHEDFAESGSETHDSEQAATGWPQTAAAVQRMHATHQNSSGAGD